MQHTMKDLQKKLDSGKAAKKIKAAYKKGMKAAHKKEEKKANKKKVKRAIKKEAKYAKKGAKAQTGVQRETSHLFHSITKMQKLKVKIATATAKPVKKLLKKMRGKE